MPPNRFESEVGNFLEGSHGDRTHIKRAGHHTVTPLCGTLLTEITRFTMWPCSWQVYVSHNFEHDRHSAGNHFPCSRDVQRHADDTPKCHPTSHSYEESEEYLGK